MANLEDLVRDLREKNSELVQEVQYWKTAAAQKDNEKLDLIKDINELRLKLSRLRSGGEAQARKLEAGLQDASKEALTHLVQASSALTRTIELTNQYMMERQELETSSPRWSGISGTPSREKVHRVPPLLIGGQSIQPVVSLSRTILNTSANVSGSRNSNLNQSTTERAVPMHMLQDVYIPLIRIDMADLQSNNIEEEEPENSADDIDLEENAEHEGSENSQNTTQEFETSRRLDAVIEDVEPEDEVQSPPSTRPENPLEGPSWLLDSSSASQSVSRPRRTNQEPDSTTACEDSATNHDAEMEEAEEAEEAEDPMSLRLSFTPTVRRRKRSATPPLSPHYSPAAAAWRHGNSGRVLKVVVAKMRLSNEVIGGGGDASPPKRAARTKSPPTRAPSASVRATSPPVRPTPPPVRAVSPPFRAISPPVRVTTPPVRDALPTPPRRLSRDSSHGRRSSVGECSPGPAESPPRCESPPPKRPARFEAPSPNGATDARLVVLESSRVESEANTSREFSVRASRECSSRGDSAEHEGRSRRPRRNVTYKEKPLNRKLRR